MKTILKRAPTLSVLAIAAVTLATACGGADHADADLSTTRTSPSGLFTASYTPDVTPVPLRKLHTWTIEVRDRDGRPVDGATLTVDGGMPDHGHGLPTQPAVREAIGGGRYVVDGMKFNMGGYWVVDVTVSGSAGKDTVRFELML
ncbi:MAG: FixH family protein [Myxococcales bacterium]